MIPPLQHVCNGLASFTYAAYRK